MSNEYSADDLHAPLLTALNLPWKKLAATAPRICVKDQTWMRLDDRISNLDFYYLERGRILIMHVDADGKQRAIFSVGPGNLINEATAAAGFDAPDSPFISVGESILYRFSHSILADPEFVRSNPDLMINLAKGISIKLLIMHTSLSNFTGVSALCRISRFFYSLYLREKNFCFDPGMTQESLAVLLGMNRSTLVRALHHLKDSGAILKFTKRKLCVGNPEILRRLAAFSKNHKF